MYPRGRDNPNVLYLCSFWSFNHNCNFRGLGGISMAAISTVCSYNYTMETTAARTRSEKHLQRRSVANHRLLSVLSIWRPHVLVACHNIAAVPIAFPSRTRRKPCMQARVRRVETFLLDIDLV
ncbi:uncharacterized protein YALI1_C19921g [Yarrowia lipolytica]|uniref:Uncharacterized protein n=1 Tax=Yarrowia lipolytica TaxID=4952 RepID=A0A1D8NB51_YARLL|nr:hypothetical protein YALI1_C19921g [Yarrowia lipolytica]